MAPRLSSSTGASLSEHDLAASWAASPRASPSQSTARHSLCFQLFPIDLHLWPYACFNFRVTFTTTFVRNRHFLQSAVGHWRNRATAFTQKAITLFSTPPLHMTKVLISLKRILSLVETLTVHNPKHKKQHTCNIKIQSRETYNACIKQRPLTGHRSKAPHKHTQAKNCTCPQHRQCYPTGIGKGTKTPVDNTLAIIESRLRLLWRNFKTIQEQSYTCS